ncbi:hypothetical protein CFC21_040201 [Triticum aestivum]|uniref:Uncharacterized protein n=2 Tax=Triticum aestivum TaxID=4565 RepID=A0A3B6FH92_WHEAT|nr:uncharacterized protein LOC123068910 [Triticum aestivum]KAF7028246.1 hypothetical protein CFC21_040201 [Triticum aestivum]
MLIHPHRHSSSVLTRRCSASVFLPLQPHHQALSLLIFSVNPRHHQRCSPLLYPARPLPAWRASALPQVLRSYRRLAVLHPNSRPCFFDDALHSWSPRPRWLATSTSRLPKAGRSFDACSCCCGWGGDGLLVGAQGPGVESPCRGGGAPAREWLVTGAAVPVRSGGSVARQIWRLASMRRSWRRGRRPGGATHLPVAQGFWGGSGESPSFLFRLLFYVPSPYLQTPLLPSSLFSFRCFFSLRALCLLFFCIERPWPPDARAPLAKDPPASRLPPCHSHLAGDLHQVPSSARATLRPLPAALQPERFSRLPKQRRGTPCHEHWQTSRPTLPPSRFPPSFFPPRCIIPSLAPAAWSPAACARGGEGKWISRGGARW